MPAPPIFDQSLPRGSTPATSNLPLSRGHQQDSPLASQLPAWDLVPAHTLLVRRRPGPLNATSRSEAPDKGPMAPAPLPPPAPSVSSTGPGVTPPLAAVDRFCQNCGLQLEEGATFCADCGTKV
jgi:hypothetical protein